MFRALKFSQDLGFLSIILEGDLEVVIKALLSDGESFAFFGHLILNVKSEAFNDVIFFPILVYRVTL